MDCKGLISITATHTKHYVSVQVNKYTTVAPLCTMKGRQSMALPSKLVQPLLLSLHEYYTPIPVKNFVAVHGGFFYQSLRQNRNVKINNKPCENMANFKYSGTTLRNQNFQHEEIKCRLNSRNVCCSRFFV